MGATTATGAILIITGWFSLIEFDTYSEAERKQILQRIKRSPASILLIALMPAGILINVLGSKLGSVGMVFTGASFIFVQGIIVSLLFWKRKRWKGMFLLAAILVLGIFLYIPLFIR